MADPKPALKRFLVGKYVCPSMDELVPVWSSVPISEMDCPLIIEHCQACGEKHSVACDDLLEADDSDPE
jgi:hypothetical protein